MEVTHYRSKLIFAACLVALLAVISTLLITLTNAGAQVNDGSKLVTLHDRGQQRVFITHADTLKGALEEANVSLESKDAVEPSLDEKLVAPEYAVNVYRARPVVVIDGPLRQKVITPYQSAERIAQDAGISLYPEDQTSLSQGKNFASDGAGLEMTIKRATPVNLTLYSAQTTVRTQAATVDGLLKEKNITLGDSGRVSVNGSTPITANMELRVWREGKQTVTAEEEVAFATEKIQDADQEVGYKNVKTPGVNGKRTVTYEVNIIDGKESSRTEIASVTTLEAVKQVEVVGVKTKSLAYTGGGTKTEWLAASNIPQESWGYADAIVTKESGWNPNAVNRSSGACGLAQALPCSKVPGNPYNPVDSLNWMNGYVNGRYGGWKGAYDFWQRNRWY